MAIPTPSDLAAYTDAEFAQLQAAMAAEQQRRYVLAQAVATGTGLAQQYVDCGGNLDDALDQIRAGVSVPAASDSGQEPTT